jgi:hypothetical protein
LPAKHHQSRRAGKRGGARRYACDPTGESELRGALDVDAASALRKGATGQDVSDTVLMLQVAQAGDLLLNDLDRIACLATIAELNCLIIDEDGVYDARLANDRLLLGMKRTVT